MLSRTISIAAGIVLIGIAVAWFVTPLSSIVLDQLLGYQAQETRGLGGPAPFLTNWDTIKTVLDMANVVIGGIGIFLTLRSRRPRSSAG